MAKLVLPNFASILELIRARRLVTKTSKTLYLIVTLLNELKTYAKKYLALFICDVYTEGHKPYRLNKNETNVITCISSFDDETKMDFSKPVNGILFQHLQKYSNIQ